MTMRSAGRESRRSAPFSAKALGSGGERRDSVSVIGYGQTVNSYPSESDVVWLEVFCGSRYQSCT